jgi:hypothetical protein
VIVLVAILFGSGVLLGMVSLVVDSGQLLLEKTITQISADNVATALAHGCAANTSTCTSTIPAGSSLVTIAESTFSKHPPAIISACGSQGAVTLRPSLSLCGNYTGIPRDCVAPSASYPAFVRVYTGYTAATGGTPLFPLLNNLIHGTDSNPSIEACSQAAWGSVGTIAFPSFPMILSLCTAVDPRVVGKTTGLLTTDPAIEGFTGAQNSTTISTCAGKKDQFGSSVTMPTGSEFLGFEMLVKPASGKVSIGDNTTEATVWNTTTINTYRNTLASLINSNKYSLYPVVADTRSSPKKVIGFASFKPLAYKFKNPANGSLYLYYPNTAATIASFPTRATNSCTYFCLVGSISNATSQSASLYPTNGSTSYNLGVNTILPLQ